MGDQGGAVRLVHLDVHPLLVEGLQLMLHAHFGEPWTIGWAPTAVPAGASCRTHPCKTTPRRYSRGVVSNSMQLCCQMNRFRRIMANPPKPSRVKLAGSGTADSTSACCNCWRSIRRLAWSRRSNTADPEPAGFGVNPLSSRSPGPARRIGPCRCSHRTLDSTYPGPACGPEPMQPTSLDRRTCPCLSHRPCC